MSFSTEPPRSSTQILTKSARVAAISSTTARASSGVDTPNAVGRMVAAPGPRVGPRDAPERGVQPGPAQRARFLLGPDLERKLAGVGPHRDDGADAVVGVPLEVVDQVLARVVRVVVAESLLEPDVPVQVDERRHDRLAAQVDHRRVLGDRHAGGAARGHDAPLVDHQHPAPDGRAAVSGDEGRPLVGDDGADRGFGSVGAATGGGDGEEDESRDRANGHLHAGLGRRGHRRDRPANRHRSRIIASRELSPPRRGAVCCSNR